MISSRKEPNKARLISDGWAKEILFEDPTMKIIPQVLGFVASVALLSGCAAISPRDRAVANEKERDSQRYQQDINRQVRAIESRVSTIPDAP